MDTIKLSRELEKATYSIEVWCNGEKVSGGSAVAFNSNGYLLTAGHVVVRLTHIQEDYSNPDTIIIARSRFLPPQKYVIHLCPLTVNPSNYFRQPLVIDLAILIPLTPQENVPYLEVRNDEVQVGEQVLMAGFPDEIELPFSFDKLLDFRLPEVKAQGENIEIARQLLMVKSGMIGHKYCFNFYVKDDTHMKEGVSIQGEIFYVDNVMHSGSSGGPVISHDGKIAGVIVQRAITPVPFEDTPNLQVPSGSCVAFTPRAITNFSAHIKPPSTS